MTVLQVAVEAVSEAREKGKGRRENSFSAFCLLP